MPFLPPEALSDERSIATAAARAITLAKGGETRAALNLALQARRRAKGLEIDLGELEALNAAAIVHMIRGDAIAAVAVAIDACDLARRTSNRTLLGHSLVSLKMSAYNLGACENVDEMLLHCIREAVELDDPAMEIRARVGLGVVLGDAGNFDAAEHEYTRALLLARRHPNATGAARITANLANLHRKRAAAHFEEGLEARALHECAEAIRAAEWACQLAFEENNTAVQIDAMAIQGCAHGLRGDMQRAHSLLRASVALGQASRCPTAVAWVLCELGRHCVETDRLAEAHDAYTKVLDMGQELRPSRKIALACAGLAEVEAKLGNVTAARRWRERSADESAQFEIARLQTRRQLQAVLAP